MHDLSGRKKKVHPVETDVQRREAMFYRDHVIASDVRARKEARRGGGAD